MHITTLEEPIDHFANEFDIDHIHTGIHRALDARTESPSDHLLDAEESMLAMLVPDVPEPELIAPGVKGYWVTHHGHFIGVPYNEATWPRIYIFYCCVYTVMENLAEK